MGNALTVATTQFILGRGGICGCTYAVGRLVVTWMVLLAWAFTARAGDGHGWAIVTDDARSSGRDPAPRFVVMHLPPRVPGGPQGVVRAAQWLLKKPERLCWYDNRVYLVMPSETVVTESRRQIRRVLSLEAHYSIAGVWTYLPQDGPELFPSLPGEGDLVGLVGSAAGPIALLRNEPADGDAPGNAGTKRWRLMVMDGREWIELPFPTDRASFDTNATLHLVGIQDGLGLLCVPNASADAAWWTARLSRDVETGTHGSPTLVWTREPLTLTSSVTPNNTERGDRLKFDSVVGVDSRPVALSYQDSTLSAYLLLKEGPVNIARKQGITSDYQVAPRAVAPTSSTGQEGQVGSTGNGVISILWPDQPLTNAEGSDSVKAVKRQPRAFHLFELFASGRVLYDGPARQDGPLSIREVQLLSIVLGGILIAVVAFVLRPVQKLNERVLRLLPRGFKVASTPRRAIATAVDFVVGAVAARALLGLNWEHAMDPGNLGSRQGGLVLLVSAMAMTWMHATIMEWQLGTTLGKLLVDCRVISIRMPLPAPRADGASPDPQEHATPAAEADEPHPLRALTLRQAAVRNMLKWIPPLSLAVFIGPRPRHFADQAAGTLVVEPEATRRAAGE